MNYSIMKSQCTCQCHYKRALNCLVLTYLRIFRNAGMINVKIEKNIIAANLENKTIENKIKNDHRISVTINDRPTIKGIKGIKGLN